MALLAELKTWDGVGNKTVDFLEKVAIALSGSAASFYHSLSIARERHL